MTPIPGYVWLVGVVAVLIILDRNVADYLILQTKRVVLFWRSLLLRLQLEKDLLIIRYHKTKYLKQAKELLQELGVDASEDDAH